MKERENFSSRLGFMLVSAGCAIGLGNVWKFPYICGEYGGAAFILIYLVFLAILGFPILMSEYAVGRGSRKGIARAYDELESPGSKWHIAKWFGIAGNYLLMMFYTLVSGWMLCYVYYMVSGKLALGSADEIAGVFSDMLASPGEMSGWMITSVLISFAIVVMGLKNGVEKITKVMMCILLALMVFLAIYSLTLDGAMEGVKFYLVPDFNKIVENGIGNAVFAAMTHAFFTLSIGMGSMEIFGSYLSKGRTIAGEAKNVVLIDTFVALTAGIIIIPACFAFGIQPDAGPPLLFITLPSVFSHMQGGQIIGSLFFIFMSFAAISTVIAVFENIIAFFMDLWGWSRKKAVLVNLVAIIVLSMPAVLGYNVLSSVSLLGDGTNIMDFEDFIVSYNVLPLGSLAFVLFCTCKNGWGTDKFIAEVNDGKGMKISKAMTKYMKYVLPVIIAVVYLKGYYDMFAPKGAAALTVSMVIAALLIGAIFSLPFIKGKNKQ